MRLRNELADRRRWHRAHLSRHFRTVSEQDHCRDGRDPITAAKTRDLFSVHFRDHKIARQFRGDFANFRRHHFAWAAPRRPKIDQDWQGRMAHKRIKDEVAVNIERFTERWQLVPALTASECPAEAFIFQTVPASAIRAGSQDPMLVAVNVVHWKTYYSKTKRPHRHLTNGISLRGENQMSNAGAALAFPISTYLANFSANS